MYVIFRIFYCLKYFENWFLQCDKGDEVLSVNGVVMQGLSHGQAIKLFKEVKFDDNETSVWNIKYNPLFKEVSFHSGKMFLNWISRGQAVQGTLLKQYGWTYDIITKSQVRGPMSLYLARRGHEMRAAGPERGFR